MKTISILFPIGLLLLALCRKDMTPYELGSADNPRKVLIASMDTEFKRNVIAKVIEKLGPRDYYFKVIGLDRLQTQTTQEYGAILVAAWITGGKVDNRAVQFFNKDAVKNKTILLYTAGMETDSMTVPLRENVRNELRGLDAVGSASSKDRVEMRAEQLAEIIRKRF